MHEGGGGEKWTWQDPSEPGLEGAWLSLDFSELGKVTVLLVPYSVLSCFWTMNSILEVVKIRILYFMICPKMKGHFAY